MKIKHLLSFFAAGALLFASCTEENEISGGITGNGDGTDNDTGRQEVLLSIKNGLVLKDPNTKAADAPIATEEENYIHSLDVYVFGSLDEFGPYVFQELHYYRADGNEVSIPGVSCYSFNLNNDPANSAITNGLLKLNKGLFVKLYCVANRTEFYQTSADGATTAFTDFHSLEQTKPGQADNTFKSAGIPTEEDFKKLHIKLIDPDATDRNINDVLTSPLPMSGAYVTPLDLTDFGTSARTQISFKLSRMVARFDIVNDASKSKFTLERISMGNGQKGARFFPIETVGTKAEDLIIYPERPVSPDTQVTLDEANNKTDKTIGAFYTYPSPKSDEGFLMLKGKYAVNKTENKEVSYQVPFQQMVNGVGTYIEVAYNHRYTIEITGADTYHLDFNLKVADWDEPDALDPYNPENDFDKTAKIVLEAGTVGSYVLDNGQISVLPDANSKFAFKMGSNAELTHELIYKSATAVKWLVEEHAPAVSKASSMETTFTYKVDGDALTAAAGQKLEEVKIRLTNPASGQRKEIRVIPTPGPTVSFVTQEDNYNTFDASKLTAYIYNVADQNIKLTVAAETRLIDPADPESTSVTGSTATVTGGTTWIAASSNVPTESGAYTLTVDGTGSAGGEATIDFASIASTAKTPVKVILKDAAMTALTADAFQSDRDDNTFSLNGGTGSIPQVSLVGTANNSFTLTVTAPEGVKVEKTGGDWLEVTSNTTVNNGGKKVTTVTGRITDATGMADATKSDGKFTFTNILNPADKVEVEVVTTVPAAPTVTLCVNYTGKNTFTGTNANVYNADGQSITLTTDMPATLTATDADFLTIVTGATDHIITLNAAQTPIPTAKTLTFTTADGATKEITVTLVDAAITPLLENGLSNVAGTNTFTAASDSDNAKVTMSEATASSSFSLSVTSKEGITIGQTADWLKVTAADPTGSAGSYTTVVTVAIVAGTDLTTVKTGTIVLKNAIQDGGDLTVDVATTLPTPPAP